MEELDALVRRADEDRWLASRFAPPVVRRRLIAVYTVNHEIARTPETVREATLGDIRLAWWREAIEEVFAGKRPRSHPALAALHAAHEETSMPQSAWERLIDARRADLEPAPFTTRAQLEAYIDATAGGVMRVAAACCAPNATEHEALIARLAQRWGVSGILRSEQFWRGRGRDLIPADTSREELLAALRTCSAENVPAQLFPSLGYAALLPTYLRRDGVRSEAPLLQRQFRLVVSSATGRV